MLVSNLNMKYPHIGSLTTVCRSGACY